jgi:ketosteroid isomerase-like protein
VAGENVAFVRNLFDAFPRLREEYRRGTLPSRYFEGLAEDVEWDASEIDLPDIGREPLVGREAVREFWIVWLAAWEDLSFTYELRETGDRVVALIDQVMRVAGGLTVTMRYAQVWTFRAGEVVHWKLYRDQGDALTAAGLGD